MSLLGQWKHFALFDRVLHGSVSPVHATAHARGEGARKHNYVSPLLLRDTGLCSCVGTLLLGAAVLRTPACECSRTRRTLGLSRNLVFLAPRPGVALLSSRAGQWCERTAKESCNRVHLPPAAVVNVGLQPLRRVGHRGFLCTALAIFVRHDVRV